MARRICVVVDSRANFTRAQTVAESVQASPDLELQLVTVGVMSTQWASWFPPTLKPDNVVNTPLLGDSLLHMVASYSDIIEGLTSTYRQLQPDIVVALTDRYETLAVASTAAMMNIRVAHIQGGELSGTIDESIRHAVTKLSHIHFPATDEAAQRIISMGEDPNYVYNVGCPASDLLLRVDISQRLITEPYILVLYHPVTTEYGESYRQMLNVLQGVKAAWDGLVIVVGPNHDPGNRGVWQAVEEIGYRATGSVPHEEWVNLMAHALVLVGNSSAGIREACYFGTPVLDLGSRQYGRMPRGRNVFTHYQMDDIKWWLERCLEAGRYAPEYLYGNGNAGVTIARILAEVASPPVQKRFYE